MKIGMNHGAGGEVMEKLIKETILSNISKKSVNNGIGLEDLDDGATIPMDDYEIIVTTDGHTVQPLFFPGGDIGRISAAGTINDVSMMGAKPLAITNAMIVQEGFDIEDMDKIMKSMNDTCAEADVALIAGDTKVMESNKLDGIRKKQYINWQVKNRTLFILVKPGWFSIKASFSLTVHGE